MNTLAKLYIAQGRYADAEELYLETIRTQHHVLGDTHPHTLESWNNLIDLYDVWGKPGEAEQWRAKLPGTEVMEQ